MWQVLIFDISDLAYTDVSSFFLLTSNPQFVIYLTMKILRDELKKYFNIIRIRDQDNVVIGNIAYHEENNYDPKTNDALTLTLLRLEEEKTLKNQVHYKADLNGVEYQNPPVYLNMYVLFTPHCAHYENDLAYLSAIVRFFQSKMVFTHQNTPGYTNDEIESFKIIVDLYSPTFEENNHIWSVLGGKQLPFVVYKVRLAEVAMRQITDGGGVVKEIIVN